MIVQTSGETLQVGVSSFIRGFDPENAPNVFARVSTLFNWIRDTVCARVPRDEVFCRGGAKAAKRAVQVIVENSEG